MIGTLDKPAKENLEPLKLLARDLRDGKEFPRSPRETLADYVLAARAGQMPRRFGRLAGRVPLQLPAMGKRHSRIHLEGRGQLAKNQGQGACFSPRV